MKKIIVIILITLNYSCKSIEQNIKTNETGTKVNVVSKKNNTFIWVVISN